MFLWFRLQYGMPSVHRVITSQCWVPSYIFIGCFVLERTLSLSCNTHLAQHHDWFRRHSKCWLSKILKLRRFPGWELYNYFPLEIPHALRRINSHLVRKMAVNDGLTRPATQGLLIVAIRSGVHAISATKTGKSSSHFW